MSQLLLIEYGRPVTLCFLKCFKLLIGILAGLPDVWGENGTPISFTKI